MQHLRPCLLSNQQSQIASKNTHKSKSLRVRHLPQDFPAKFYAETAQTHSRARRQNSCKTKSTARSQSARRLLWTSSTRSSRRRLLRTETSISSWWWWLLRTSSQASHSAGSNCRVEKGNQKRKLYRGRGRRGRRSIRRLRYVASYKRFN